MVKTVRGINNYFSEYYKPNISCPLCSKHLNSLPELLTCTKLKYEFKATKKKLKIQAIKQIMRTYFLIPKTSNTDIDIIIEVKGTNLGYSGQQ